MIAPIDSNSNVNTPYYNEIAEHYVLEDENYNIPADFETKYYHNYDEHDLFMSFFKYDINLFKYNSCFSTFGEDITITFSSRNAKTETEKKNIILVKKLINNYFEKALDIMTTAYNTTKDMKEEDKDKAKDIFKTLIITKDLNNKLYDSFILDIPLTFTKKTLRNKLLFMCYCYDMELEYISSKYPSYIEADNLLNNLNIELDENIDKLIEKS